LQAIDRAPVANPGAAASSDIPHCAGFTAGARQIVSKLDSYGLRPESTAALVDQKTTYEPRGRELAREASRRSHAASAEGVGALLAGDRPGTGRKTWRRGFVGYTACAGFTAGARQIVSKLDSYGLRPESTAALVDQKTTYEPRGRELAREASGRFRAASAEGVGALLAGDRPGTGRKLPPRLLWTYRIVPDLLPCPADRQQAGLLRPAARINGGTGRPKDDV